MPSRVVWKWPDRVVSGGVMVAPLAHDLGADAVALGQNARGFARTGDLGAGGGRGAGVRVDVQHAPPPSWRGGQAREPVSVSHDSRPDRVPTGLRNQQLRRHRAHRGELPRAVFGRERAPSPGGRVGFRAPPGAPRPWTRRGRGRAPTRPTASRLGADLTVRDLRVGGRVFDPRFRREGPTTRVEVLRGDPTRVKQRCLAEPASG